MFGKSNDLIETPKNQKGDIPQHTFSSKMGSGTIKHHLSFGESTAQKDEGKLSSFSIDPVPIKVNQPSPSLLATKKSMPNLLNDLPKITTSLQDKPKININVPLAQVKNGLNENKTEVQTVKPEMNAFKVEVKTEIKNEVKDVPKVISDSQKLPF